MKSSIAMTKFGGKTLVICLLIFNGFFAFSAPICSLPIDNCVGTDCSYRYTLETTSAPIVIDRLPITVDFSTTLTDSCYGSGGLTFNNLSTDGIEFRSPSPIYVTTSTAVSTTSCLAAGSSTTPYSSGISGSAGAGSGTALPRAITSNTECLVLTTNIVDLLPIASGRRLLTSDPAFNTKLISYRRWYAGTANPARCQYPIGTFHMPGATIVTFSNPSPTPPLLCNSASNLVTSTCEATGLWNAAAPPEFATCQNGCDVTASLKVPAGTATYYSSATPLGLCAVDGAARTCSGGDSGGTLGTMSGPVTHTSLSCDSGCGTIDGIEMRHGVTHDFFTAATAPDCSAIKETRTCTAGVLPGSATVASCVDTLPCTIGQSITWGAGSCGGPSTSSGTLGATSVIPNTTAGQAGSATLNCGAGGWTVGAPTTCSPAAATPCGPSLGLSTHTAPTTDLCTDASLPTVNERDDSFDWLCGISTCSAPKFGRWFESTEAGVCPVGGSSGTPKTPLVVTGDCYDLDDYIVRVNVPLCTTTEWSCERPSNILFGNGPRSPYYGGGGGSPWGGGTISSELKCPGFTKLTGANFYTGVLVDSFEFKCDGGGVTARVGGGGGGLSSVDCPVGKYVTGIIGSAGLAIDNVGIICSNVDATNSGAVTFGPFGGGGGSSFSYSCPAGTFIRRLTGRNSATIDGFQVYCSWPN